MKLEDLNNLTLLYIEDDNTIRQEYCKSLRLFFKTVYEAIDYDSAMEQYTLNLPDIILVDIQLDGLSGIDIVKMIRKVDTNTPIVFLTAHNDNKYLLEAANLQIDGYIVKPLDIDKLQKAMSNCLKKLQTISYIELDENFKYNQNSKELFYKNSRVSLGKKENMLLDLLLSNKNRTVSREELEYTIWEDTTVSDSSIKNLIGTLRKKIGKEKIVNILGVGWKINI